ncbi:NTP transferase domain-containing protein [Candidatus Woesearchaeota archaeon]|nr:NTP transferase domain-containing protein [Candidatus Woesearchaeota archaeon]
MKVLILAGGFGERLEKGLESYVGQYQSQLQEWIQGKPKALVPLKIGDEFKPLLAYQLDQFRYANIPFDDVYIQSNGKYFDQFQEFALKHGIPNSNVMNNGVMKKEERLGPLGDLRLALETIAEEDLLVVASDTLILTTSGQIDYHLIQRLIKNQKQSGGIRMVVYEGEPARLRNHGLVVVNEKKVIGFQEKPQPPELPQSNLINASIHLYPYLLHHKIKEIHDKRGFDESVNLIGLVYQQFLTTVEFVEKRLDLGRVEDLLRINTLEVKP